MECKEYEIEPSPVSGLGEDERQLRDPVGQPAQNVDRDDRQDQSEGKRGGQIVRVSHYLLIYLLCTHLVTFL